VRRALLFVALCLAGAAALPSIASAGQYHVLSCRDAAGDPLSTAAWVPFGNVANPLAHSDTCSAGEWLGIQMIDPADYDGGSTIGYAFTPPAGTTIAAYDIQMAGKTSSPTGGTHFELGLLIDGSPTVDAGDGCRDDLDPCLFGDWQDAWDAPINRFARSSLSADALAFGASCTAPSACVVGTDNLPYPAFGRLFRSDVTIDDPVAPTVSAVGGTIADPGPVAGQRTVTADAADVGGGVQRVELLVDGVLTDQLAGSGRCAVPYTAPAPCPDATTSRFSLDTTTLVNGSHTIVVRAVDAAGNTTPSAPLTVDVANAASGGSVVVVPGPSQTVTVPAAPSAAPVPAPVAPSPPPVSPASVTLRTSAKRVTLARAARLRGTASRGGVRLAFERRPFGGDEDDWKPAGTTTTAGDGSFRFPTVRRSGQIRVRPAAASVGGRALIVSVVGPLRASLHSSASRLRNGKAVTLRGRVRGDGGAWTGREALIQAIVRGHWRTIDTADVSGDGRIAWRYRFAHTRTTAEYRFRLRLAKVRPLPWKTVTTRPVSVLVRGA
jgi:hypothetical protein